MGQNQNDYGYLFANGIAEIRCSDSLDMGEKQGMISQKLAKISSLLIEIGHLSGDTSALQEAAKFARLSAEVRDSNTQCYAGDGMGLVILGEKWRPEIRG